MLRRYVAGVFVILCMCSIFYLSTENGSSTHKRSTGINVKVKKVVSSVLGESAAKNYRPLRNDNLVRKLAHVVEYMALTLLLANLLRIVGFSRKKTYWTSFLLALGYASIDELHQAFVPGRNASPEDVLIDCIGITISIFIMVVVSMLKNRPA